jgi:hypothetical protein
MASRFSARSDRARVRLGSEASRRTNGRPDMYTEEDMILISILQPAKKGASTRKACDVGMLRFLVSALHLAANFQS